MLIIKNIELNVFYMFHRIILIILTLKSPTNSNRWNKSANAGIDTSKMSRFSRLTYPQQT